jgi:hypothetical protein
MRLGALVLIAAAGASACGSSARPNADAPAGSSASTAAVPTPSGPLSPSVSGQPSASAATSAAAPASSSAAAATPQAPAPVVADNKVSPTEGGELQERARALFQAIVKDDPALAEPMWFPREPFIPLKDIKDPGKYWAELHRTYAKDVHALHEKRKSWDGAEFVSFDGWSTPKWVPPGDEANKIGYYRAFRGKLRYKVGGEDAAMDVHVIITWQGRWYVTHLRKFKK